MIVTKDYIPKVSNKSYKVTYDVKSRWDTIDNAIKYIKEGIKYMNSDSYKYKWDETFEITESERTSWIIGKFKIYTVILTITKCNDLYDSEHFRPPSFYDNIFGKPSKIEKVIDNEKI